MNLFSFIVLGAAQFGANKMVNLVMQSGWVAKIVLAILLIFSVFSWAIIFKKHSVFKKARTESQAFLRLFRRTPKLADISAACEKMRGAPLVEVFLAGFEELENQIVLEENSGNPNRRSSAHIKSLDGIQRALQRGASAELTKLEKKLSWLATTGTVTPFIGLFGTVWGIINAFEGLGTAGSATLKAVAPGISEALVTTAAGLFAAIPAVVAYNHYLHVIKEFAASMDDFALEFLNLTERNFL